MGKRSTAVAAGAVAATGGALAAGKLVHDRVADRGARNRARRFRLEPSENARDGIARVADGQLELAIALIEGRGDGGPDAIHEARKSLKRVRALLRLCRPRLGEERFRQENTILRDAGRSLSGIRDAQVLLETLDELRSDAGLPERTWSSFREVLDCDAGALEEQAHEDQSDRANVALALAGVRARVEVWPLPDDAAALAEGLELVYRKARRARRRAERHPSAENLHELRKRTKDVWHAGQVLSPVGSKRIAKLRRRAHKLADVLGSEHDLTVLLERAESSPAAFEAGELELLRSHAERHRRALRREALARGARLYRRKPRKLARGWTRS